MKTEKVRIFTPDRVSPEIPGLIANMVELVMSVFQLEPIDGTQGSPHWQASTLAPMTVWVNATSETDARERLTFATAKATRRDPNRVMPLPPWEDFGLVTCIPDSSRNVPEGFILTADGESLAIANH